MNIDDIRKQIEAKYPMVDIFVFENNYKIELSTLRLPKEYQNKGIGSDILKMLQDYSKIVQKPIVLSPEADRGKKGALKRFYKNNGFVDNKGRNKDYKLSLFGPTMHWKGFREFMEF